MLKFLQPDLREDWQLHRPELVNMVRSKYYRTPSPISTSQHSKLLGMMEVVVQEDLGGTMLNTPSVDVQTKS